MRQAAKSNPKVHLFAFEKLEPDLAVFAGNSAIKSTQFVQDPRYIVVPGIIDNNIIIIYYSFGNGPFQLYHIKKKNGRALMTTYTVTQVNDRKKYDAKKILSDWISKCASTSGTSSTT